MGAGVSVVAIETRFDDGSDGMMPMRALLRAGPDPFGGLDGPGRMRVGGHSEMAFGQPILRLELTPGPPPSGMYRGGRSLPPPPAGYRGLFDDEEVEEEEEQRSSGPMAALRRLSLRGSERGSARERASSLHRRRSSAGGAGASGSGSG
eukprot:CAMPEP_0182864734 /NCGR_PEP_ID=MMETSP0034_2-20130328/7320_1 /TAXON_ID=156128 /ORGANISM="Nephroselmis pyriformis, Strain CCMP717" /LENGTH=148 /DNA_ID=CAMNT_0024996997 /DNA_START=124 /DNA_END=567 /DNA_ORIENTATION=+